MRHIIGTSWVKKQREFVPCLKIRDTESKETRTLELEKGSDIELRMSKEKMCTGFTSTGWERMPCPQDAVLGTGKQCDVCRSLDHYAPCLRCKGEFCASEEYQGFCFGNRFYVYLAQFGNEMKVGVTAARRLVPRLVEQGADIAAALCLAPNGLVAREVEAEVAGRLHITDRVTREAKKGLMFERNDFDKLIATKNAGEGIAQALGCEVVKTTIICIDDMLGFRKENTAEEMAGENVVGEVIGAKGSFLFLRGDGGTRFSDLEGHVGRMLI